MVIGRCGCPGWVGRSDADRLRGTAQNPHSLRDDPEWTLGIRGVPRIAGHLQWLNDQRRLFVRALVFQETLIADFEGAPRSQDINPYFPDTAAFR